MTKTIRTLRDKYLPVLFLLVIGFAANGQGVSGFTEVKLKIHDANGRVVTAILGIPTDTLSTAPAGRSIAIVNNTFYFKNSSGVWVQISGGGGGGSYSNGYGLDLTGSVFGFNKTLRDSIFAAARDRSTHTGTQAQSTITDLTTDLAARLLKSDTSSMLSVYLRKADTATLSARINAKQDLLVSGTNIKTINSTSLLGSGNISVVGSYPSAGIPLSNGSAWVTSITDNSSNWNTAYTDRLKWDGGSTGLNALTGRTSLGATTVGSNIFTVANPSAIRYIQINADNTVTLLDAAGMRTALSTLTVSGSPTAGTMARWLNSTTVGTSLFYDNGNTGGFNTTSPRSGQRFTFDGTDGSLGIFNLTTTQRDAIVAPSTYGIHFNTTLGKLEVRKSGGWEQYSTDQEIPELDYDVTYDTIMQVVDPLTLKLKSIRVRAGSGITVNKIVGASTLDYEIVATGTTGANTALGNLVAVAINTALLPATDNSIALGSASKTWSDLYLGNGGVIDFNAGDVQLIHGSNNLSLTGGNFTADIAVESTVGGTGLVVGTTNTQTLSNKRWVPRVGSTTSSATPTINTDSYDIYKLTAQATDITSFTTNLTGTPNDGDILEIQITGTAARAITWGASFVASTVALPTTTVTTATLTVVFQYYTTSSYGNNKWVCVNSY